MMMITVCLMCTMCNQDDEFEDETFNSDELRILKISEGDRTLTGGDAGVSAFGLELTVVFSHPVSQSVTDALVLSNSGSFTAGFDDTNSILTLVVNTLEYETVYELSLPAGTYGLDNESSAESYNLSFSTSPFVTPNVSLTTSANSVNEGESVTITAILSESTTEDVTVSLSFNGSAVAGTDFNPATADITISALEESSSITLTTTDDMDVEGQENIVVEVESLINAQEATDQQLSIDIVDNDLATNLVLKGVLALEWTTSGNNGGKAVHLKAIADIPDLSVYSIGVAIHGSIKWGRHFAGQGRCNT